jgi:NAD(P)-dependent dehydrogenase (short-subunit alcohol dehydrogenase family)
MQSVLHKVIGPKEVHPENLDGRVAVVTGGALGIGCVKRCAVSRGVLTLVLGTKSAARLPSLV